MASLENAIEIYPSTTLSDPEELRETLTGAIRNPITGAVAYDELNAVLEHVPRTESELAQRYCVVAKLAGDATVIGMMSLKEPDKIMRSFAVGDNPVEITNAYVLKRGIGVGTALLRHLEVKAREDGRSEIVLISGPRYMRSGWPFWRRQYGEPVGVAKSYFEDKYDGKVWRKSLSD